MKFCLINNLYPPNNKGGTEVVVQNIAQGLKAAGHEVFVITTDKWENIHSLKARAVERDGIKLYEFYPANIYHYSNSHKHNLFVRYLWHFIDILNLQSFFVIKKILEDEKPDIVWTHNLMGVGMLTAEAIKFLGVRHWHTVHDVQLSLPSGLIIRGREESEEAKNMFRPFYERAMRDIVGSPQIVFSPSKWLMDFYVSRGFFGGSKQVVLPNPVIFDHPQPLLSKEGSQTPPLDKGRLGGVIRFLYLGQVEEHKGVRMLVKTFRHLLNEGHDNLELTVAGGGALTEEIKVLAFDEERIKILGLVPHEKIGELFVQADYTIVPSLCYENSPTVIFESFSHGVPVLASNFGGIPEIVKDGVNGYLFNPDENSLKDAILRAAGLDNFENLCHNGYVTTHELSIGEFSQKVSSLF